MNTSTPFLGLLKRDPSKSTRALVAGALVCLTLAIGEGVWIQAQRATLQSLESKIESLEAERDSLAAGARKNAQELSAAKQQLDAVAAETRAAADRQNLDREVEIRTWIQKVKGLRSAFEQKSDQKIPELALLDESDWLRLAKETELDTADHVRAALAAVRHKAKGKFFNLLSSALSKFKESGQGQWPANVFTLAPYFSQPIDSAILQRYEIFPSARANDLKYQGALIRERTAPDESYDDRFTLTTGGGWSMQSPPLGWIDDITQRSRSAAEKYMNDHHGVRPVSIFDYISYFDPPLPTGVVEKLKAQAKEGRQVW